MVALASRHGAEVEGVQRSESAIADGAIAGDIRRGDRHGAERASGSGARKRYPDPRAAWLRRSHTWAVARRLGAPRVIPTQVRIFVCTERQDMRRSFDGLALAVRERLALDPESGA